MDASLTGRIVGTVALTCTSPKIDVATALRVRLVGPHGKRSDAGVLGKTSGSEGRVPPEMTRNWHSQQGSGEKFESADRGLIEVRMRSAGRHATWRGDRNRV
jgi:hypothetical protein